MDFNRIFELLDNSWPKPRIVAGIPDFVPPDCPHKNIGKAYDKAIVIYDDYMQDNKLHLRILKRVLLGMRKEDTDECVKITKNIIDTVKRGIVLDIPCGTGVFTFEEYVKAPDITFVAADYSWGMLGEAKKRLENLKAKNIILIRADVGKLPFKDQIFDGILTLNGIHSFPDKAKAISEMSRVLKDEKAFFGTLCVKGERWLTDLSMELFYFPGKWFTRPALSKEEMLQILKNNNYHKINCRFIKAGMGFEALKPAKSRASAPD